MAAFLVLCQLWLLGVGVRHELEEASLELDEASLHLDAQESVTTACPDAALLRTTFQKLGMDLHGFPGSHCEWDGVECHSDRCTVKKLDLSDRRLTGELPAEIGGLAVMEDLRLHDNPNLRGELSVLAKLASLKVLRLSFTEMGGDLSFLSRMEQMQILDLANTQIQGTLQPLAKMIQMTVLVLTNSRVSGDLMPLADMEKMRGLGLAGTQVEGTLQPLAKMIQMTELWLTNSRVSGDLMPLADMEKMERLGLAGTHIEGKLQPLAKMIQMTDLALTNSRVGGGLMPLADMEKMEMLGLAGTQVEGTLQPLAKMIQMTELWLTNSRVGGGLMPLADMEKMERLSLAGTHIEGKLQPLAKMIQMTVLVLTNSRVGGDLMPLADMEKMRGLDLGGTQIQGQLQPLANMTEIIHLQLQNTRVGGELRSLQAMRKLRKLRLEDTGISGPLELLTEFAELEEANLASTAVTGRLTPHWRGHLKSLRQLNLAASTADFLPRGDDLSNLRRLVTNPHSDWALLPALFELDVSGCHMNGNVMDLIAPLAACKSLAKVAASNANLTGDVLDLTKLDVEMDGGSYMAAAVPLAGALQVLDLSGNRIHQVKAINAHSVLSLADNGQTVDMPRGMLRKAMEDGVRLDLTNVALVDDSEAKELIAKGSLNITERRTMTDSARGFACHGMPSATLQITPSCFLPDVLCGCQPGWHGRSTDCRRCGKDHYNAAFNQSECQKCPSGSSTPGLNGSDSSQSCRCEVGRIYGDSCQCEPQKALHSDQCVDCNDLKLDCVDPGSLATKAPPTLGHARLYPGAPAAKKCLDPAEERCNASANGSELGCVPGYEGPLCATCADRYRSQGRRCKKCEEGYEAARWPIALAAATAAAGGFAFFAWWRSRTADVPAEATPATPTPYAALWPLLLAQGPVLLQFLQLWGVLVALSKKSTGETTSQTWDQEYVQWLQLTAGGLRDALSLECEYGRNARLACAVLGPVLPLLLLAACAILEAVLRGRGVSVALQVLSLAFIGGASSCAGLLRCQELDGGGEPLGKEHAFRSLLPHLKCSEAPWVAAIGWGCAIGYGIFIPACMVGLMVKQQWSLAASRRIAHSSAEQGDTTKLRMVPLQANSEDSKEMSSRVQLAAAVAYSAVFYRGSVQIKSADGCLVLQPGAGRSASDEVEFDADNILSMALDKKADADLQRWQAITRMLKERCIIEEAAPSDRVLAGAKELFFKYANCQSIWVEVALKLVVVGIVAVPVAVATSFQLMFTLTLTLGTSIVLGTLKPYRQRQVNDLQCFCFFCLSVAAGGFTFDLLWLTRAALVAPVVTAAAQTLRPDCRESLSLRLFEAASAQWQQGGAVQLNVETLSFI